MIYSDINLLKQKINQLYRNKIPFFFIVNYEQTEGYCVEAPLNQKDVYFKFPTGGNKTFSKTPVNVEFESIPNNFKNYKNKYDQLQKHITEHEIVLANLTEKTEIKTNILIQDIFTFSNSKYQVYLPGRFVCFSPERFIRVDDGRIYANPMKGTIDAAVPEARQTILNDEKEVREHTATVNLLINELNTIANNVHVAKYRYIDVLKTGNKTLLQVSSEIVGDLLPEYINYFGDFIFSLLPAGSIVGTPKQRAFEVLSEIETIKRGYYCGVAGYFDGNVFDSAVLIRFIEQDIDNGMLYFRSGGGITADSVCEKEYQEVLNKVYLPFRLKEPVFVETLKIKNCRIQNFELHQERMHKTTLFHFGTKPSLNIDISAIPANLRQTTVKCRVLYSSDIITVEFHEYVPKKIYSLQIVEGDYIEYSYKSTDRREINSLFEQRKGADDIIVVKNGKITDSSFANLVFEDYKGQYFTPSTFLLDGTKRKNLINIGLIKEIDITTTSISNYKKIYLINSMIDIEDDISVQTEFVSFT